MATNDRIVHSTSPTPAATGTATAAAPEKTEKSTTAEKKVTLSTENLAIGYRQPRNTTKTVGSSITFQLEKGEVVSLLGRNGVGKSTLIKTLCGYAPPLHGTVSIMGSDIRTYQREELSKIVGVVLTDKNTSGGITVRELVSLGRYPHTGFFARLRESDRHIVELAMEDAGIAGKADCHLSEISDGERQKAFVAKALAQECPLIILDEPTAFLDVTSRIELMKLLFRTAHNDGRTILVSTHDLDLALRFSDRLLILAGNCAPVTSSPGPALPETATPSTSSIMTGTPAELLRSGVISSTFGVGR